MRTCEDCKIILDPGVRYCPNCGMPVADETDPGKAPDTDVESLLTSANLHRIRGEWDEAVADAAEALKKNPRDSDIAALLGNIYEQRGMLEDALIWYQMAVELNPAKEADVAALKRVQDHLAAETRRRRRVFHKKTKLWAAIIAGVFLIIAIIALIATLGRSKPQQSASRRVVPESRRSAYQSTPRPPVSASQGAGTTGTPTPEKNASSLYGTSNVRTEGEWAAKAEIADSPVMQQSGATVDDFIADPRGGVGIITISIPTRARITRADLITAASCAADAAFTARADVQEVVVRIILTSSTQNPQIGFVGNVSRQYVSKYGQPQGTAPPQYEFTQPWWNPQIMQ